MDLKNMKTTIPIVVVLIFGIILLFSSFYSVNKDEQAVITRFGKFSRLADPGLNMMIPLGVERRYKIPVKKVLKQEFGFITTKAGVKSEFYRGPEQMKEARMLSADLKVIQVEWIVQYKINDPKAYLFNVNKPGNTLRDFSIIAMNQVAGDYLFDEIITIAKSEIVFQMQELLEQMIDEVNMGVDISTVQLINVTPPSEVEAAYNEVLQAQQEKDKIMNEAKTEFNKRVIPVEGEAERLVAGANGYLAERTQIAQGDANYFNQLYREYIKAPDVTKKRIYLETMADILPRLQNIYILDDDQKNMIPLLQMGLQDTNKGGRE
jgi:membrane protease subunit HflK